MPETSNQNQSQLLIELSRILRCISCQTRLLQQEEGYSCPACRRMFPIVRGVARFVDEQSYAGSFGYQWQTFDKTQLDHAGRYKSEPDFIHKTGLRPEELKGKLVLDVGCGMGRFAEVATRWGAQVVGIDLSAAAEVAARNLRNREFVAFQADVFRLPFAPATFDYIYSIGVLHHTPDCERAVKALPQYLKPGGQLAVWLYSGYNKWYRFSDIYRKFTTRLSTRSLHGMLRVAVPVINTVDGAIRVVPLIGRPISGIVRHVLPVNRNPQRSWRVLDTFDWYSPKYQSKHTYEQVFRWFESCGLEDLHVGEIPVSVRGQMPLQ